MTLAFAVEVSQNSKTGPVSTTYASQASCPTSCPLMGAGCYAESGPLGIHTKRLASKTATPLEVANAEAEAINSKLSGRQDLRLHVVGDCKTDEAANIVSSAALNKVKSGRSAWSYTHAWRTVAKAAWNNLSILASVERLSDVVEARDRGYASAIVLPEFRQSSMYEVDGVKVLPCPAITKKGVQCVDCRLCMNAERLHGKGLTIGFTAHGSRRKRVLNVIG